MKKRDFWVIPVVIVLLGGIVFSIWKLYGIFSEYHTAEAEYAELSGEFVRPRTEVEASSNTDVPIDAPRPSGEAAEPVFQSVDTVCPFEVGFERMWLTNTDVVAWISSSGTAIDYPVLHGETNDTYLHTTMNGTWNSAGSIFVSYLCSGDPGVDCKTVVYGHNMKNGSMFHSIKSYSRQSYYEEHPYIWYVTPDANYLLYVIAGYVVSTSDDAYIYMQTEDQVRRFIASARSRSDFTADMVIDGLDADQIAEAAKRTVVLSTCSYEFNDARYIVVTVPLLAK